MNVFRRTRDMAARKVAGSDEQAPSRTYYTVEESGQIFHNYFSLEFELATTLAGAVSLFPKLEAKTELSHYLHHGITRAKAMRDRLSDFLVYEPEQKLMPKWTNFVRHLMTAPTPMALLGALYYVIRPTQEQTYKLHARTTLSVNDAPTKELLEMHLPGLRQDIEWGQDYVSSEPDARVAEFEAEIREHLHKLGGVMGMRPTQDAETIQEYPTWKPPIRMALEDKFELQSADRYTLPDWPEYEAIPTAYTHFTELPVIDIIGVTVYDGRALNMPFEYYHQFIRQLWDEARHCQMGFERLQAFGVDPYKVPIPVGHYTVWANLPLLTRLASLTQVGEACSFAPKRVWVSHAWERKDVLSALEHEYDIVDERTHVRFGAHWIPVIMKKTNDDRSVKQVVQDADWQFRELINALRGQFGEKHVEDLGQRFMGCASETSPVSLAPALDGIPNIIA